MTHIEFAHKKIAIKMPVVHVHAKHELYYLAKGNTKYIIDDEIYPVEAGNVVFIPKGHYHMTDSGDRRDVERYVINFDDTLFDSDTAVILDELIEKRLISIPLNRVEGLEEIFDSLERASGIGGEMGYAISKIHTLSILSYICRHKKDFTPTLSEADMLVHRVSGYISENYSEELSLSILSHKFSVSESHLSRRFKAVSGLGLNEYITFVRIINAERLLREGNETVTSVSEKCGFSDPNYFSTVFKKIKGITPLKFAKNAKSDTESDT